MIKLDLFPDGKRFAVTFSYDDGVIYDERLIEIFNKNGIKATFNVNSGRIGSGGWFAENLDAYRGHEIACHGVSHASLAYLPTQNVYHEIFEDRLALEKRTGKHVFGLAYANGSFSDTVIETLKSCGICYARAATSTMRYDLPTDFMRWDPTCHHRDSLTAAKHFMEKIVTTSYYSGKLLFIWGHSYEFDRDGNWELIEEVAEIVGNDERIYYATCGELYNYVTAQKRLEISADNTLVHNPSAITVWFSKNGKPYEIKGGETLKID